MKIIKQSIAICLSLSLMTSLVVNVDAKTTQDHEGPELTEYFTIINEDGTCEIVDYEDIASDDSKIEDVAKDFQEEHNIEVKPTVQTGLLGFLTKIYNSFKKETVENTEYEVEKLANTTTSGVVYINSKSFEGDSFITYKEPQTGHDGYTTGSYGKDAAYIGQFDGKIRAMQAGCVMDFDPRDVLVLDYTDANVSYYIQNGDYLEHVFYYGSNGKSNKYRVGYKLSYLQEGKKYYSYDGHYFYTDYQTMIKDYQNTSKVGGVRTNSINPKNPYYNYYQYLPHRSKTNLTAQDFDNITEKEYTRIKNNNPNANPSKMLGLGKYYIEYQNAYGANASLVYGVSANESAYGTSNIARDKNNLFGHGAVDSNPYYGANGYATPQDSIKYHSERFVSWGYLDNEDYRYRGGHLGDKLGGMNVKYASDPFWGEKAASVHYYQNTKVDYGVYTIGIISGLASGYKQYKEPSTATVIHTLGSGRSPKVYDLPVIILDTVTDSSGTKWYKIQSDTPLNASRTDTDYDNVYSFSRDYYYVKASTVKIVSQKQITPEPTPEPEPTPPAPTYKPGDVNGDGSVTSLDYIQIKNHIMETKLLTGDALKRADVNGDGKITSLDYIKIKNHIMGTAKLF